MNNKITFSKDIGTQFQLSIQDQRQGEMCLTFYKAINCFMWYDKHTLTENMKTWRKSAKNGSIKICKYNNKTVEYMGKIYYTFVIQSYKNNICQQDGWCPLMLCGFNTMVSGYGYCFRTQENRDTIYNYVMKDINEPN